MRKRWIAAGTAGLLIAGALGGGAPASADQNATYELTIKVIGPDGKSPREAELWLAPLGEGNGDPLSLTVTNGTVRTRVGKDSYLLDTHLQLGSGDVYQLVQPELKVDGNTTAIADTRLAKPVVTRVERKTAREMGLTMEYLTWYRGAGLGNSASVDAGHRLFTAQVGPLPAGMTFDTTLSSHWAVPGPKGDFADTPFTYDLYQKIPGQYPTGRLRMVRDAQLTKVVSQHTKTSDRGLVKIISSSGKLPGAVAELSFKHSGTVTHLMDPVRWDVELDEVGGDRSAGLFSFDQPAADARRWNASPFYPSWRDLGQAIRRGDKMELDLLSHTDQDGHVGASPLDTESMKLYRDGKLVSSTAELRLQVAGLDPKPGSFRLEAKYTRPSWSPLSVSGSVVWTFRSQAVVSETALPLRTVRFRPAVDADNLVRRTPLTVLPFQADARAGVPAPKSAKLQYSGDDGKTWRKAAVLRKPNGTFVAVFPTPKSADVSLRAQLTGPDGSTVDQTLIHAYRLR